MQDHGFEPPKFLKRPPLGFCGDLAIDFSDMELCVLVNSPARVAGVAYGAFSAPFSKAQNCGIVTATAAKNEKVFELRRTCKTSLFVP